MGNNGSIILIPILIFLLRWQLVSGAGPAGNTYSGDPDGKYGSGNPYSGYPNGQGFGLSGKLQATYCGQNQTLPCAEVNALQAVINGFRLLPTIYISSTYCGYRLTTINCTCYRDDKNFILCHITEIYMSSKDLSGYIDPAISGLQFLKILELSNNQLTGSIPASLGNLTNLERLYIINNQLVGSIPESFKNLKSLKILDLSSNYLDGPIPSLRDLQNLNTIGLRFNFLNGPIPASLGNLSSLQILNLYSNILSGPIPDDLGNLTQLQFLALDDNELNGKLPEAFGKLSNITALWLGSNYISGNIPQNYSYLTGLQIFSVAGNDLSGKIPDYIAKWKNLTALILLGNNFDGNLPEGIFKLEKLQTLWVSGLTNPGFAFPKQEKLTTNLYSLILRNCSINGTIPSYIAQWLSLTNLDLSFNNLIGEIPKFSPYLKKIFLTRNKLNGTLPPWIINEHNAPERTNDVALMDLSNNDFANVPSVNHENGTLSDSPNSIIEPRSEYISQKIKECKVKYRSLSINSGGEAVKFGKQNYENDTALSNFYLSPQGNWAYSFSGDYISPTINASGYIKNLTCGVSLPEAQLYVNARVAPVSLTYYAFCLHQGKYNVELHFAETLYSKKEDHSKVGKRVFDVHIQGKRVLQDFNIKKEAGDANKNVMTRFPATVAKNKPLSIEFFWTGRGSLYNPPGQNGPLISAISITRAPRKLSLWEIVVIVAACVLGLLILLAFMWRMGWIGERELRKARIELETQDGKKSFTVKEIIDATGNFSPRKKIGKDGRFGIIYKAELSNLTVAVKKLFPQSKAVAQIGTEVYARTFKLVHDNLVQLLATYSRKDLHLLIYEYMDHGSLEQALFDPKPSMQLSWKTRYSICLQIAQGLEYLHAKNPPIIHRDIKASNILLDGSSKAKISDFGLAKLYEEDNPFMFIEEGGTRMYMAPEYATHKAVTVGVDVFSFGVLLLEIVTGIKNDKNLSKHHDQTIFLLEKVANLHAMVKDAKLQYKKVKYAELVDEKLLNSNYSEEEVVTIIDLAMLCTDQMASLRPIISDVVSVLEGKEIVENVSKIKVKESSTV